MYFYKILYDIAPSCKKKRADLNQKIYFLPLTRLICNCAGMQVREGLHYNPYFPGGAIAMPKMLNDGAVEYEDGTPATEAQVGIFSPFYL